MPNMESKNLPPQKEKKSESKSMVKSYLVGYNLIQTIGWTYLLGQFCGYYSSDKSVSLYDSTIYALMIFQNAAVLEVVHAYARIVKSNPMIVAMQVASRVLVVCGVLLVTHEARESIGLSLALFAWCITEIIRYANYTLALLDSVPYFLVWLRYTTFIVLYPIGVTGELLCIYAASKEIGRTQLFTINMPNSLNFVFNYQHFLWFMMFLYIPLFPRLYMHMFAQRIRVLGRGSQVKAEKEK